MGKQKTGVSGTHKSSRQKDKKTSMEMHQMDIQRALSISLAGTDTLIEGLNLSQEEQAKTQVVLKLAPLADLYLCDAFATAHRCKQTLVGMEEVLTSAMGRLFEKEVNY